MTYYRINGTLRHGNGLSIDAVDDSGKYLYQVAFWFKSHDAAQKRLQEIITEDAENGVESSTWQNAFPEKAETD